MRTKRWIIVLTVALLLGSLPVMAQPITNDVSALKLVLDGLYQGTNSFTGGQAIDHALLNARALMNLATGNPLGTPVDPNQVLAIWHQQGAPDLSIIIFDRSTSNVVATLANVTTVDGTETNAVDGAKQHVVIADITILGVGGANDALVGGALKLAGQISKNTFQPFSSALTPLGQVPPLSLPLAPVIAPGPKLPGPPPPWSAFSGVAIGTIDLLSNGEPFHLLVPGAWLYTGQKLATIIVDTP